MPFIFDSRRAAYRDVLKAMITHVGASTDTTAWAASQTSMSPGGGTNIIKPATKTDINTSTFEATMSIDGSSEFTGLDVATLAVLVGPAATDALGRFISAARIRFQAGRTAEVGVRVEVQDNS